MTVVEATPSIEHPPGPGIAQAASIIALGNVASRVLGLVRETVIADLFGATGLVSAFRVASIVPTMIYDLLIGGMISSALIPVFSDYARPEKESELWRVASIMISLTIVTLSSFVLLLEIFAPQLVWLLSGGFEAELQAQTVVMVRLIMPAVIFLSLSGIITGLLYSRQRFTYPAFTVAVFNASIVVVALFLARAVGIISLVVGVLVGAILQVALQLPGLRRMRFTFSLDTSHPGLHKIIALYVPVVLGLAISQVGVAIDRNLASRTGEQSIAWMQNATTLRQLPLGLVAAAISLAVLPSLSQLNVAADLEGYKRTLARGIRMVLVLTIPATVGLFVLAKPIVALIFEHGQFNAYDTHWTTQALNFYLLGLPFAAIDQPLIFAFYARKDTKTPVLVGVLGVIVYLVVALALIRPLGMIGLVLANSLQLASHALVMLALLHRRLDGVRGYRLVRTTIKALLASLLMGMAAYFTFALIKGVVDTSVLTGELMAVGGAGLAALICYAVMLSILQVEEGRSIWQMVWGMLKGRI